MLELENSMIHPTTEEGNLKSERMNNAEEVKRIYEVHLRS